MIITAASTVVLMYSLLYAPNDPTVFRHSSADGRDLLEFGLFNIFSLPHGDRYERKMPLCCINR